MQLEVKTKLVTAVELVVALIVRIGGVVHEGFAIVGHNRLHPHPASQTPKLSSATCVDVLRYVSYFRRCFALMGIFQIKTAVVFRLSKSENVFAADTRGAAAVEFALVALPFLGTLLVSMAVGIVFFFSTTFDFAVQKAARSMMTGVIQSGQISASQYQSTVFCPMLMAAFNCSNIVINVRVERAAAQAPTTTGYSDLVNATQTALLVTAYTTPGSAQFCTGQPGDYVFIQVLYPMAPLLAFLSPAGSVAVLNGQPAFLLDSTLAFRNEQFSANSGC